MQPGKPKPPKSRTAPANLREVRDTCMRAFYLHLAPLSHHQWPFPKAVDRPSVPSQVVSGSGTPLNFEVRAHGHRVLNTVRAEHLPLLLCLRWKLFVHPLTSPSSYVEASDTGITSSLYSEV
ncbi:unnamed protein product [Urochloa humidicola]